MTFAKLCREADKKQRRKLKDARLEKLRRLMANDVSLECAWHELNERPQRAARSTVEALMYSLRGGVGALGRPDVLRRLAELSDAQIREIAVRAQKFRPHIAPAWTEEDVRVLLSARGKLYGQDRRRD
jgi:hypothetical protein